MAILWHEMWHEALEEASRQYFGESNVEAMLNTLMPLHEMMQANGGITLKEIAFVKVTLPIQACPLPFGLLPSLPSHMAGPRQQQRARLLMLMVIVTCPAWLGEEEKKRVYAFQR